MKKTHAPHLLLLLFSMLLFCNFSVIGQTTVFTDDFDRGTAVIPLGNGGTPSMTYTTATTSTGSGILTVTGAYSRSGLVTESDYAANIAAANNAATPTAQTAGRTYITAPLSGYDSPFNSTLASNTGPITWTFNMRTNRTTALSGFTGTSYAAAVVLAATSSDFMAANGYAVVEVKGTTRNAISLVRFAGGFGATPTTIIGPSTDNAALASFFSVKVIYTPTTNTWQLYVRDDASTTVKGDPTTTATQVGTNVDNTYTGSTMTHFGLLWNHSAGSLANTVNNMAVLDDYKVTVNPVLTPSLSVSASTLTSFNYVAGSGTSASQTYNISGQNLTGFPGNIAVTGSTNYEVSTDNSNFSGSVNVAYASATLGNTPIYVRLKAGLSASNYNSETLGASGGGATASSVTCSGFVVNPPTTYTWQGADLGDWQVSSNWSPARTTPAINDILHFNDATTKVITNVPTQTVAQFVVSNNTSIELQSSALVVLTIAGDAGVDFDVQGGSALKVLQATNTIGITLSTGATGSVAGAITYSTAAHTLTSPDASGITFQGGGTFTAGTSFTGNAFGTTNLNSIVFASGAKYNCLSGGNPFGATAPNSVVVWQSGSTFVYKTTGAPALSNRTYANFEFDNATGNSSLPSANPVTMDNLIVTSGSWGLGVRAALTINANISVATGATLDFNPSSAGTVLVTGAVNIAAGAKLTNNTNSSLTAASFNINSNSGNGTGTYLDNGTTTVSGTSTVQQYLGTARNWYVSSPISAATTPANNITRYYEYVEPGNNDPTSQPTGSTAYWKGLNTGTSMVVGKGYIAQASAETTVQFSGTLNNNAQYPIAVTRTTLANKAGFNMVGNPYSAYIDWSLVIADGANSNIGTSFWYRTKNTGDAYTFSTHNGTSGMTVTGTANTDITKFIPPMQAFWVRVNEGTATTDLTLKKTMLAHRDVINNKFKASQNNVQPIIRLQVSNGVNSDESLIYFDSNAQNNYDAYDSPKMFNNTSNMPEIYTQIGTEKLVINGFNSTYNVTEIPIGFVTAQANNFTLTANELRNFGSDRKVILVDKNNDNITETELSEGTSYHFTAGVTPSSINRFSLLFRAPGIATGIENTTKQNAQVFVNAANQITINAPEKSNYAIYNAVGQLFAEGTINHLPFTINHSKGVYVVKVNNQSTRVIIK